VKSALTSAFVVVIVALAAGCGSTAGSTAAGGSTVAHRPQQRAKTPAQLRAEAKAKAKAARIAARRRARKRAATRARAKAEAAAARARAKARAAYIAAMNRWHRGYYRQDYNVYWKWVNGRSCADYALNGCWHVEVVTHEGCPSYLGVEANEYQANAVVGDLLGNNGTGIPPKTPIIIELDSDSDAGGTTAGDVKIDCE
jgi:hypothetical protein